MQRIYKYELQPQEINYIKLPIDSRVLSVEEQNDGIVVYALVDTDIAETKEYTFIVLGTGQEIGYTMSDFAFLGTVKMLGGMLMFHVFYREAD